MRFAGSAVHYYLVRQFGDVICDGPSRRVLVDYPLLYDEASDMSGHAILVPRHERPKGGPFMKDSLCVCMGAAAANSARNAGLAVVEVRGGVTFPRLYNFMQSLYVAGEAMDARLRAYVDSYAGFQLLIDAVVREAGFPCAIIDEQYRSVYAATPDDAEAYAAGEGAGEAETAVADLLETDAIDLFMASRGYRHMRSSHNVYTMPGASDLLMKNVFADGRLVGTLVMRFAGDALSARYVRFILDYLAPFVEEMHARLGSFDLPATGSGRVRIALRDTLEGDSSAAVRLEAALAEDGHDEEAGYVMVRIERSFTNEGPDEHDFLARRFELAWPQGYCFAKGENLYMLVDIGRPGSKAERAFFGELPPVARDNLSKVGVSRPLLSMAHASDACLQADGALECGSRLDPTHWCYRFEEYALPWLLLRARRGDPYASVGHPALVVLGRYDHEHGSDMVVTLAAFIRHRYNATAAADDLYVARSTLLNRLERIQQLTGIDLDDPDERLYLALSLAMVDLEARQS